MKAARPLSAGDSEARPTTHRKRKNLVTLLTVNTNTFLKATDNLHRYSPWSLLPDATLPSLPSSRPRQPAPPRRPSAKQPRPGHKGTRGSGPATLFVRSCIVALLQWLIAHESYCGRVKGSQQWEGNDATMGWPDALVVQNGEEEATATHTRPTALEALRGGTFLWVAGLEPHSRGQCWSSGSG